MLTFLFWVSIIAGGALVLLMLLSLLGVVDIDTDLGDVSSDADGSSGGIGLLKGFLTFLSVAAWVMRYTLLVEQNTFVAAFIGVIAGLVAFTLLNYLFKYLLRSQENVNWSMDDAIFAKGEIYLRIPEDGEGIAKVLIRGAFRELPARSFNGVPLNTGTKVVVMEVGKTHVTVRADID